MNLRTLLVLLVTIWVISSGSAQNDQQYLLRYPSLSPDGQLISFSYQGDIWKVPISGGMATRLTVHESYESEPQWSPDGTKISFTSNRHGNNDIFVLSQDGTFPRRLTYHSAADRSAGWGPNGEVVFCTRRAFAQVEREQEFYKIDSGQVTPSRMMNALGDMPAVSPSGRYIAFTRGSCRIVREAYTGPANHNLWLYDQTEDSYRQLTDSDAQEIYPDWGDDETLFYLSAENGTYNVHKLNINRPSESISLTSFTDTGIRYFDLSADGRQIIFERGIGISRMAAEPGAIVTPVQVELSLDSRFYDLEHKSFSRDASDFAISPNEKYLAFTVRGDIFVKENDKDKKRSIQITDHPFRDQSPIWLNDSTLLFISDRNGQNDVFMIRSNDPDEGDLLKTFKREVIPVLSSDTEEGAIYLSPDRCHLAYIQGRGVLKIADIDSDGNMTEEETLLDGWDTPEGLSWSPDSKWIAYALADLDFNEEIYIHPADNQHEGINVSLHPRGDQHPVWSPDGSKLGFESIRNNGDSDIWFVWLKKEDWEKTKVDWEEVDEEEDDAKNDSVLTIDFEDIHERLVQVTHLPGNEGDLQISKDGSTFFFSTNGGSRTGGGGTPDLAQIKWDGEDLKIIKSDIRIRDLFLDDDGKHLYVTSSNGSLSSIKIEGAKSENLPFTANMDIDYRSERDQIFEEGWRSLNAGFYDPDFHGQDWLALKEYYKPLAMAASTSQDFRDIFNVMLGQLNASHMGMYGSDREETQDDQTGRLGVELIPVSNGMLVSAVVGHTPATRSRSLLREQDIITHVNLKAVRQDANFYAMLDHTVDEEILLNVIREGQEIEVVIRPTGSINDALYRQWVDERKRLTDTYSDGKLGYIHIQGMNWSSFERFERELAASGQGKEGIVIDVRFNGGGWTTDMLMTVLNVRQHAYTVPRGAAEHLDQEQKNFTAHYPYGERLPLSAWTKPSIALCNQNSYSNAEIFSHAYKTLGIGTLVGMPTFGAVISTGGHSLIDDSCVRMPFRGWYVKATEENMEHGPAVPDILVENPPDSKAKGDDPQLKRAVEELLGEIGN